MGPLDADTARSIIGLDGPPVNDIRFVLLAAVEPRRDFYPFFSDRQALGRLNRGRRGLPAPENANRRRCRMRWRPGSPRNRWGIWGARRWRPPAAYEREHLALQLANGGPAAWVTPQVSEPARPWSAPSRAAAAQWRRCWVSWTKFTGSSTGRMGRSTWPRWSSWRAMMTRGAPAAPRISTPPCPGPGRRSVPSSTAMARPQRRGRAVRTAGPIGYRQAEAMILDELPDILSEASATETSVARWWKPSSEAGPVGLRHRRADRGTDAGDQVRARRSTRAGA